MYTLTCSECGGIGFITAYIEKDTGAAIEAKCHECDGMGIVPGYDEGDSEDD